MRKLVWFSLGFGTASFICAYFYRNILFWLSLAFLLLSIGCFVAMRWRRGFRIAAALLLGAAVGFAAFCAFDEFYLQKVRTRDLQTLEMLIIADEYSWETRYGCAADGTVYIDNMPYRVRVYLNDVNSVAPGDLIQGTFRLHFTADGGDDIAPQYRGKGIFLTASQKGSVAVWNDAYFHVYHYPVIWRSQLKALIDKSFPGDVAAFAKGLLLGDRTDFDYETETAFKVSGISHIIAVSGLHISILYGLISLLTVRRRFLTVLVGVPTLLLFAAIVGFTPSVTRACIMYILMMLAFLFFREYDPPTELAFSVLVMLLVNPFAITSVSLQMSVACMVGILLFSRRIRGWILDPKRFGSMKGMRGKLSGWLAGSVSLTLGSMVLTMPLCAYYFGAVSLVGVLTNLLTLWVIAFVFYGLIAVCVAGVICAPLATALAWVVAWPMRYVMVIAKGLSAIPFAAVYTQSTYILIWIIFCYVLLASFFCLKTKPVGLFASAVVAGLVIAVTISCVEPALDNYRVTILNVGQGQCILLQSEGRTFMVDCGGDYDEGTANIAAEKLLSQGVTELDGVVITHYDADHAGGLPNFLTRVDAQMLYLPDTLDANDLYGQVLQKTSATITKVQKETVLRFGDCELMMYPSDSYNSQNESSMCILFRTKNCDILITGDRGETGEMMLLKRHVLPDIEVLVVGHHGSATSTSELLLQTTKPEYAVISVGANNAYGHPTQAVLDRLRQYGCEIYRTDRDGTIIFRG